MKSIVVFQTIVFGCVFLTNGCSNKKEDSVSSEDKDTVSIARPPYAGNSPVRLNEVVPVNISLEDHQGDDPAWLELYNPADTAVQLSGYALTDDLAMPRQWVIGDLVVPPKGYQLVYLSGKNIRETRPARDSINLMSTMIWDWNDSYRSPSEGEPGHSASIPYEYPAILGADNAGRPVVSATLKLGDNMTLAEESLRWSNAMVGMDFVGAPLDLSGASVLVVKGYIQNGRELTVRLVQGGMDSWLCWAQVLKGNGIADAEYRISLPQGSDFPNLRDMLKIQFEATTPYISSVDFTIRDVYVMDMPVLMHANFKVGRKASAIYLLDSNAIRDSLAYQEIAPGVAWGYDQKGAVGYLLTPTPWAASTGDALTERQPAVATVQVPGFYREPIQVALQVPTGAQVFYTTDGSEPTGASTVYTTPVALTKSTVIRSFARKEGDLDGPVSTQTFFIDEGSDLPVVSISTEPDGLFHPDSGIFVTGPNPGTVLPYYGANFWAPKELPVHVEFFDEKGSLAWAQNAGLSIFGNYSRNNEKKAVSIKFREKYGPSKLKYPLFSDHPEMEEFRTLALRANGGNLGSDYIRDALAQNLADGLDVDYQRNRPVVVFYNGKYYGLYQMLQKMDSKYPETAYGIAEENVEFIEPSKNQLSRSWADLEDFTASMSPAQATANAKTLDSVIDVEEYLNYMAVEFYVANTDWPANNLRVWRGIGPETKWRWMLFDMDFGFGSNNGNNTVSFDMFSYMVTPLVSAGGDTAVWPNGPQSTALYRKALLENPLLRKKFLNRLTVLLAWQFAPKRVEGMIDSMMAVIQSEVPKDQARWGFAAENMESNLATIRGWAKDRPEVMRDQMRQHFGLGASISATLNVSGAGTIRIDGLPLPSSSLHGPWFADQSFDLEALPRKGAAFIGWSDGVNTQRRTWIPQAGASLQAEFH